METPIQIEFKGIDANERLRDVINAHVGELESRFGRITACRVILNGPGGHHRNGSQYEVHISLALPGHREVNIRQTPQKDPRHSDIDFAISDAFHRARRQLQDQAQILQGKTKTHKAPAG